MLSLMTKPLKNIESTPSITVREINPNIFDEQMQDQSNNDEKFSLHNYLSGLRKTSFKGTHNTQKQVETKTTKFP